MDTETGGGRHPLCRLRIAQLAQDHGVDVHEIHTRGFEIRDLADSLRRHIPASHVRHDACAGAGWKVPGYA
jgi:hypothetical protein